jgi:hypothetical protein
MQPSVTVDVEWVCNDAVRCTPKDERSLFDVLVKDNEVHLRGRDLQDHRIREITEASRRVGMSVRQALSLRRMMMRGVLGNTCYSLCGGYGDQASINEYALELENAVARLLNRHGIAFLDEKRQKQVLLDPRVLASCVREHDSAHSQQQEGMDELAPWASLASHVRYTRRGTPYLNATPDFLVDPSVRLFINGSRVNWIECKAFYGTAVFSPANQRDSVPAAKIKSISERYTSMFGPGAFVFRQGFNVHLRSIIGNKHTTILDATPLDLCEGPFMG